MTHTLNTSREILISCDAWNDYELLDSGRERRLERLGSTIIDRSEPKAWWEPDLKPSEWKKAVAYHTADKEGRWIFKSPIPLEWPVHYQGLTLEIRFAGTSKHIGVFPEQSAHWQWITQVLKHAPHQPIRLLNLFGYTGVISLLAAKAGCTVTHVDAAAKILEWAKKNQKLSGIDEKKIRWIVDDAFKFAKREARRGKTYDAIILDPPQFGKGPSEEVWKIRRDLRELLQSCREILSDNPLFVILNLYSISQSAVIIGNLLQDMMGDLDGTIELGELVLKPKNREKKLPLSIFGRWRTQALDNILS
ncbi:MAG: class I SAM-dependent methyltransferase [Candidatus Omnitrophota bacterium]